jgi:hypothetical protein
MSGSWHRGVGWRQGTKRGIEISPVVDDRVVHALPCMVDFEAEYGNALWPLRGLPPGEIGIARRPKGWATPWKCQWRTGSAAYLPSPR